MMRRPREGVAALSWGVEAPVATVRANSRIFPKATLTYIQALRKVPRVRQSCRFSYLNPFGASFYAAMMAAMIVTAEQHLIFRVITTLLAVYVFRSPTKRRTTIALTRSLRSPVMKGDRKGLMKLTFMEHPGSGLLL
jgi:hypothetical protein